MRTKIRSKKEIKRRKRRIVTITVLLVVLISGIFSYKCFVYFDEMSKIEGKTVVIKDRIMIDNISNSCNVSDGYINLYIPAEFQKNDSINVSWYDLNYAGDDKRDAAIAFLEMEVFKKDIGSISDMESDAKVLERNGIKNGFDLIKYYYDKQDKNINILATSDNIKLNRMAIKYIGSLATSLDISLLEGDIEGLLFKDENVYHTVIYHDEEAYTVDFYNGEVEYFTYEKVIEFIRMIEFNS